MLSIFLLTAAQAPASPPEDGLWYYEIGGAKPASAPANPQVTNVTIGGSAQLGLGYSCLKFDPLKAVSHTLNEVAQGAEDMLDAMTSAATAAIASLPAVILQRANPGLYDLFQNALVRAQTSVEVATKSCQQIEAAIGNNKNPYEDLIVLAKGNDWKQQMGIAGNDPITAQQAVEQSNGSNGIPWIGGNRGGDPDQPIELTGDIVKAGYNVHMNRATTATGTVAATPGARLSQLWTTPDEASEWLVEVVGEHKVTTCAGCQKSTIPGRGLGPTLHREGKSAETELNSLVGSSSQPTLVDLAKVSAPGLAITRAVIEAIRELPPTEQAIVSDRLSAEVALARTVEKTFHARRLMQTGRLLPEVEANPVARAHSERVIAELDRETERLLFEMRVRKEVVSDTIVHLLQRTEQRRTSSLEVPEVGRRDPNPITNGRVAK